MILNGRNLYIVNKKPQMVEKIETKDTVLILRNGMDGILENGMLEFKRNVYACLFCKQLKNITFIINEGKVFSGSLIMAEEAQFETVLQMIKEAYPQIQMSEQNTKINGYAASVVEKLQEGVAVALVENKEEQIKCCPVCGMECDPNIPYCMECGASV